MSQNQTDGVLFMYKGKRGRIVIEKDLDSLKNKVKQDFRIDNDVELVAHYRDRNGKTEETILNDDALAKLATATQVDVHDKPGDILGIVFGNEYYSLDQVPPLHSNLIKVAIHEVVFSQFDVVEFTTELGGFVEQVRRAHLHLLAVDERGLAIDVFNLGRNYLQPVTTGSVNTLDMIVRNCANILSMLVNVFEYLRDGEEKSASINLTGLVEIATAMIQETTDRVKQLEQAEEECDKVLNKMFGEWLGKGEEEAKAAEEHQKKQVQLAHLQEKVIKEASRFDSFMWWVRDFVFGEGAYAEERTLKREVGEPDQRKCELQEITDNLTTALGAIKKAKVIMEKMNQFWSSTKAAISELSENETFVKVIEAAVARSKDDRENVQSLLRCRAFRRQGITFMAKYTAIRDVSSECRQQMKFVQKCMSRFLTEMPTKAQAKDLLFNAPSTTAVRENMPIALPSLSANSSYAEVRRQFGLPAGYEEVQRSLIAPPAEQLSFAHQF